MKLGRGWDYLHSKKTMRVALPRRALRFGQSVYLEIEIRSATRLVERMDKVLVVARALAREGLARSDKYI